MAAFTLKNILGRSVNPTGTVIGATMRCLQAERAITAAIANGDTFDTEQWVQKGSAVTGLKVATPDSVVISVGTPTNPTRFINAKTVSGGGILAMSEPGGVNFVFAADEPIRVTAGTGGSATSGRVALTFDFLPPNS